LIVGWSCSGCGFDGDGVSEGLEFGDESAGFSRGVYSTVQVVGTEVGVGLAGGKYVPDDHAEFVRDGDGRFVFRGWAAGAAELANMPAVQALQIARGARGGPPAFDEHVLKMLVALSGFAAVAFAGGFVVARAQPDPGSEMFG
jgi:hypothetical protein